jgi:hypothetical protein
VTWEVTFHMDVRDDGRRACSPFTYYEQAVLRKAPQRFFVTGQYVRSDSAFPLSNPIAAIAQELETHTRTERRVFLNNIVKMLELMEAQRDVDRN